MAGKIIWFNTKSTWIRNGKRRRSASSSQQKFFVLSCVFRSVVFESLSAMKINFSCTSLHRHSPWNFHFFLVFRCHWRFSGAPRREIKHIKTQHFGARKRISNSTARKASPSGSKKGVFFSFFSLLLLWVITNARSFTPWLSGGSLLFLLLRVSTQIELRPGSAYPAADACAAPAAFRRHHHEKILSDERHCSRWDYHAFC